MSMSTHVIGFKPPDEKWKQMKAVYDACLAANVKLPQEVATFFCGAPPDRNGVEVRLDTSSALGVWKDDAREGFEIEIAKLDPNIKIIRFYNAW